MKFEIDVTETRAVHMRYVVEARSAREAESMAAIGSTVEEHHLGDGGVLDRTLTTRATPIRSRNQRQLRIAMDISATVDVEKARAYLLGARVAVPEVEAGKVPAQLAGLALTVDAPPLDRAGLADLRIIPYGPEHSAIPTFRLEVAVTDQERLELVATEMYEKAYGSLDSEAEADLPELAYEALIGSNEGPAHLDFGVELVGRKARECIEVEPPSRPILTHEMPGCGACGSPLVVDGAWQDGAPTYVDRTGGDVCAVNGRNDRHQPGVETLAPVAAPTLER